jgi:hypothetical protein
MVGAIILLGALAVVVVVGINVYLRSWVRDESRVEAHVHDPRTHTVAYAVPNGVDPAVIKYELVRAGFTAGTGRVGEVECLLVECEQAQRDQVRHAVAAAHLVGHDGGSPGATPVVFEDER